MPITLTAVEARILGSLIEKSLTTPELYPLSLNALVNACNQKSSREPVMTLDFAAVEQGLSSLREKGLIAQRYEPGGRAAKYGHRVEVLLNSENPKEIGLICALLLRGPQTLGELKTRTERLCQFADVAELEGLLQELSARVDGPIVGRLPRQPGQKEARFQQLFAPTEIAAAAPVMPAAAAATPALTPAASPDRLTALESRVSALESALQALAARLDRPA